MKTMHIVCIQLLFVFILLLARFIGGGEAISWWLITGPLWVPWLGVLLILVLVVLHGICASFGTAFLSAYREAVHKK